MKLPWQQPPGLVEGCSSVSVGWLADMLADGPYQLLGRSRQGPSPAAFKSAPGPGLRNLLHHCSVDSTESRAWWLMPVNPYTWEAVMR